MFRFLENVVAPACFATHLVIGVMSLFVHVSEGQQQNTETSKIELPVR